MSKTERCNAHLSCQPSIEAHVHQQCNVAVWCLLPGSFGTAAASCSAPSTPRQGLETPRSLGRGLHILGSCREPAPGGRGQVEGGGPAAGVYRALGGGIDLGGMVLPHIWLSSRIAGRQAHDLIFIRLWMMSISSWSWGVFII